MHRHHIDSNFRSIEKIGLSDATKDAVINAITTEKMTVSDVGIRSAATTFKASLSETSILTSGERVLLEELLVKLAEA